MSEKKEFAFVLLTSMLMVLLLFLAHLISQDGETISKLQIDKVRLQHENTNLQHKIDVMLGNGEYNRTNGVWQYFQK